MPLGHFNDPAKIHLSIDIFYLCKEYVSVARPPSHDAQLQSSCNKKAFLIAWFFIFILFFFKQSLLNLGIIGKYWYGHTKKIRLIWRIGKLSNVSSLRVLHQLVWPLSDEFMSNEWPWRMFFDGLIIKCKIYLWIRNCV